MATTEQEVCSWIIAAYHRQFKEIVELPEGCFDLDLASSRSISRSSEKHSQDHCGVTKFAFTYPDREDGNLFWTARVQVARFNELVEFSLRLGMDSQQFVLSPIEPKLGRPQLIPNLLNKEHWSLSGLRLTTLPILLEIGDVDRFVNERLLSKQRRLPIVVISRDSVSDEPLVNAKEIANSLSGIAQVYITQSKWVSFKINTLIGHLNGCYNGAIRIYWPRGARTLDSYNPIYLQRDLASQGDQFKQRLFKLISSVAASRYLDGPITTDAAEALHQDRDRELQKEKDRAREHGDFDELLALADEEVKQLRADNERLKQESDGLRREHNSLMSDLQITQANLKAAWSPIPVESSTKTAVEEQEEEEPNSVLEAVERAESAYADTLVFHQRAFSSAEDSPFRSPEEVSFALLALHEVCLLLRMSRNESKPIGSLEEVFAGMGITYKAHESGTSMTGKMGAERSLMHEGRRVSLEKHLALGKGGPDTCLRLHFFDDVDSGKFVVGHVGRHMTNTKT